MSNNGLTLDASRLAALTIEGLGHHPSEAVLRSDIPPTTSPVKSESASDAAADTSPHAGPSLAPVKESSFYCVPADLDALAEWLHQRHALDHIAPKLYERYRLRSADGMIAILYESGSVVAQGTRLIALVGVLTALVRTEEQPS